jgi:hypothetical protein
MNVHELLAALEADMAAVKAELEKRGLWREADEEEGNG